MNERIKQLAEQAHHSTADELAHLQRVHNRTYDLNESAAIYNEKFAELIVRECVQICKTVNSVKVVNAPDTYQEGREMGSFMCMEEIKEHFGVEE